MDSGESPSLTYSVSMTPANIDKERAAFISEEEMKEHGGRKWTRKLSKLSEELMDADYTLEESGSRRPSAPPPENEEAKTDENSSGATLSPRAWLYILIVTVLLTIFFTLPSESWIYNSRGKDTFNTLLSMMVRKGVSTLLTKLAVPDLVVEAMSMKIETAVVSSTESWITGKRQTGILAELLRDIIQGKNADANDHEQHDQDVGRDKTDNKGSSA